MDTRDAGRRVELISTSDVYTRLKPGSKGTYEGKMEHHFPGDPFVQHLIKWDDGSHLMLLEGVDKFRFVDEEEASEDE